MEKTKFTLLNGTELEGILKSSQPENLEPATLSLDTSGEYLSMEKKPKKIPQNLLTAAERQYRHHLFTDNAWLLLEHAEEIMSDSKMFLTRVPVQNGLAYTGTSGFRCPTVGVYLEWWQNYPDAAIDKNGNLVWYISGSPLTGRNCCSSVTPQGEQVPIAQRTSFPAIWKSFMDVNNRYNEVKQTCEAYTLEQLLAKLRGEDYRVKLVEMKHELLEEMLYDKTESLNKTIRYKEHQIESLYKLNRDLQLHYLHNRVMEFGRAYFEKEKNNETVVVKYHEDRRDLKQRLHSGIVNQRDYHALLAQISKEYREKKSELSQFAQKFMVDTFGANPNRMKLDDVLSYVRKELKNGKEKTNKH